MNSLVEKARVSAVVVSVGKEQVNRNGKRYAFVVCNFISQGEQVTESVMAYANLWNEGYPEKGDKVTIEFTKFEGLDDIVTSLVPLSSYIDGNRYFDEFRQKDSNYQTAEDLGF